VEAQAAEGHRAAVAYLVQFGIGDATVVTYIGVALGRHLCRVTQRVAHGDGLPCAARCIDRGIFGRRVDDPLDFVKRASHGVPPWVRYEDPTFCLLLGIPPIFVSSLLLLRRLPAASPNGKDAQI